MNIYLYLLCFRHDALVASHLPADEFGAYMAVGTQKKTFGRVIFFEVDPALRSPELHLDQLETRCVPHADGRPRRSKYMSIYRAMEHIPLSAFGRLYLTTRDGRVLSLDGTEYGGDENIVGPQMYTELCPVTPRVVTKLGPGAFVREMTRPDAAVSVPRIFFNDTKVVRDDDGRLASYLPYRNPDHIVACIDEIETQSKKIAKTVDRDPTLNAFYRTIGSGFYLGDASGVKEYSFPSFDELDDQHHEWWRSASLD